MMLDFRTFSNVRLYISEPCRLIREAELDLGKTFEDLHPVLLRVLLGRAVAALRVVEVVHLAGLVQRLEVGILLEEDPALDEPWEPGASLVLGKGRYRYAEDLVWGEGFGQ
jgi:hypothetical protein